MDCYRQENNIYLKQHTILCVSGGVQQAKLIYDGFSLPPPCVTPAVMSLNSEHFELSVLEHGKLKQ